MSWEAEKERRVNGYLQERDEAVAKSRRLAEMRFAHWDWTHPDLADLAKLVRPFLTPEIQEALERVDAQLRTLRKQANRLYAAAQPQAHVHLYENCPTMRSGDVYQATIGTVDPENLCPYCSGRLRGFMKI